MRVYLVQHGDAVPKEVDPDRPLTDTGRRDIERLAKFLNAAKVRVSRIVHSGKTRAQQTAEILAKDSGRNVSIDAMSGLNPDDPPMKFAKKIEEIGDEAVIISHLPFLGLLVHRHCNIFTHMSAGVMMSSRVLSGVGHDRKNQACAVDADRYAPVDACGIGSLSDGASS